MGRSMADHVKTADGARAQSHVMNGPASKEPSVKYSSQDPAQTKDSVATPHHPVRTNRVIKKIWHNHGKAFNVCL